MSPPVLRRTCSEFAAQSVRLSNVELLRVPSRGTVVQELLQEPLGRSLAADRKQHIAKYC